MSIWVYKYRFWDAERNDSVISEEMYTLEAIRTGLGQPVIESGRKVPAEDVDASGQLKRRQSHRDTKEEA